MEYSKSRIGKLCRCFGLACLMCLLTACVLVVNPCAVYAKHGEDTIVVSLGDSYSAGEGCEPFYGEKPEDAKYTNLDWLSHRSYNSWPGQLSVDGGKTLLRDRDGKGNRWFFYAVSGALAKNIYNNNDNEWQSKNPSKHSKVKLNSQLSYANAALSGKGIKTEEVDIVTLSIGGNDLGFTSIVASVAAANGKNGLIDRSAVNLLIANAWQKYNKSVKSEIKTAYEKIRDNYPNASIIVAGYPTLMKTDYESYDSLWELLKSPLELNPIKSAQNTYKYVSGHFFQFDDWEGMRINATAVQLDEELNELVNACRGEGMDITYVSVISDFQGHEIGTDLPYLNKLMLKQDEDLGGVASAYSVHPNTCKMSIIDQNYQNIDKCCGVHAYVRAVQPVLDAILSRRAGELGGTQVGEAPDAPETGTTERASAACNISMVLDVSGSMGGNPLDETKQAASKFVDTVLSEKKLTGLVAFSSGAHVVSGLGSESSTLKREINELESGGGTNMEEGLKYGSSMVYGSAADRRIIVLMSDGEPNEGLTGDELVSYAESVRDANSDGIEEVKIYALGFNEGGTGQDTLTGIASTGCYYNARDTEELAAFFDDIASELAGTRFHYVRVACPVDVTVVSNGEVLTSAGENPQTRTSFGSLSFELQASEDGSYDEDDPVKVLRLREGVDYNIHIEGYDTGTMDYSISFMDEDGNYTDTRSFPNVPINSNSIIETQAKVSDQTMMLIDNDGDGHIDRRLRAGANQIAESVDNSSIFWFVLAGIMGVWLLITGISVWRSARSVLAART